MASLRSQRSFTTVSPAAYRERRDGWCEGVHFPIYPNIYHTLNCPGAFQNRLSLKLLVLPTKIPVACVGVLTNLGLALKFSSVPSHNFVAGQRGSTSRNFSSAELEPWHPRALRLSPSLPAPYECGGLPFPALPPPMPTWHFGAPVPFLGSPVPTTLSRSHGPLAYSDRLVRCPGCPLIRTHLSTATLPAGP